MELSPNDSERLQKVAVKAAALVVGGAIVKYVWEHERPRGYVYYIKDSGIALIGLLGELGEKPIQYGGRVIRRRGKVAEFEPDDISIPPEQIPEFERVFISLPETYV